MSARWLLFLGAVLASAAPRPALSAGRAPETAPAARVREVDLRVPSETAGPSGIAVRVAVPVQGRYGTHAPVVVHVPGGWDEGDLSRVPAPLAALGFIDLRFTFPGGAADLRGPRAVRALADVTRFAGGAGRAVDGRALADLIAPLQPSTHGIGLVGWSNGGNAAVLALARHEVETRMVAWVATWEAPVGDGAAVALAGGPQGANPAWHAAAGAMDWSRLRFSPLLPARPFTPGPPVGAGAFWFDLDGDGDVSAGEPVPRPLPVPGRLGVVAYPAALTREAQARGLTGAAWPLHILPPDEAERFWSDRDAAAHFLEAVVNRPELMAGVVGSVEDHVQTAADHPHLWAAYDGWLRAQAEWVRLNPDAAYVSALTGAAMPETPASQPLTRAELVARLAPEAVPPPLLVAAMALELADRAESGNREPDLEQPLHAVPALRR